MNQIESDHAYVYHDIINNKIVVTRDIFGKRSLVLVYIKSLSFLMLTSTLPQSIYDIKDIDDIMSRGFNLVKKTEVIRCY